MRARMLKMFGRFPVVFDGAMGTNLASTSALCNEAYNLYEPQVVEDVHRSFIDAGCGVIETNAFNANRISLAEFELADKVRDINLKAAEIARCAASCSKEKVFIAGNVGPTSRLPSLGQIGFDELHIAYVEQIGALVEGGVDLIQIETAQDLLQLKTAVIAANDVFRSKGRGLPIIVCVTVDPAGRMLLGTEMDAVLATVIPLGVSVIGLNCGVGPEGMEGAARFLAHNSPLPVLLMPNAGLPEIVGGVTQYNLGPEEFAESLKYFVEELGIEMVGGCCGTTPAHMSAVVEALKEIRIRRRDVLWQPGISSLFGSVKVRQEPPPLIIGERMNINGSKKFREAVLKDDFDSAAQIAIEQAEAGAHVLDISVAYAGRNEVKDLEEILRRAREKARPPFCVDSTRADAIEAGLKLVPGRPIINSINLEDGGKKAKEILVLAGRFGSALIALTIDESGMAKECDKKCEIADRIIDLCGEYGLNESDLFIDPLTFTLAEPRAASFGSGVETLKAIKKIRKRNPSVNTILGVSNISYGFKPGARRFLNSVFLHEAVGAGLDAAIVHAGQIVPYSNFDEEMIGIALDLVWNRREDALERFIQHFEGRKGVDREIADDVSPEEGVRLSILRGDKSRIGRFIEELVGHTKAEAILNDILLPAMGTVGRLFDNGEIPLPFVLQSAEAMKAATDILSPHFEARGGITRGKIVLATVRGDVHDIGKNLVDIILSNNGFAVINLGVKQPVENILRAAKESGADVIGLSGLLVESALIMKDELAELAHRGVTIPVVCGGAALTKRFVEKELASVYGGPVFYAADAFEGLRIVEGIVG